MGTKYGSVESGTLLRCNAKNIPCPNVAMCRPVPTRGRRHDGARTGHDGPSPRLAPPVRPPTDPTRTAGGGANSPRAGVARGRGPPAAPRACAGTRGSPVRSSPRRASAGVRRGVAVDCRRPRVRPHREAARATARGGGGGVRGRSLSKGGARCGRRRDRRSRHQGAAAERAPPCEQPAWPRGVAGERRPRAAPASAAAGGAAA